MAGARDRGAVASGASVGSFVIHDGRMEALPGTAGMTGIEGAMGIAVDIGVVKEGTGGLIIADWG